MSSLAKEPVSDPHARSLPRLVLADGTLEGLKWLALALMTVDHFNKYLLHDSVPAMFAAGRLAMPLFGFVLAYNLARPGAMADRVYLRVMKRLAVIGAIASVPFIALGNVLAGWWPLNILATLLVAVGVMYLTEKGGKASMLLAVIVFIVGGAVVEYWWLALALCVATWRYCKAPNWPALLVWISATAALYVINRNLWALGAFPVVLLASQVRLKVPRLRHAFYAYYPIHLAALWALTAGAGLS